MQLQRQRAQLRKVEHLVMKSMCAELIRGQIDEAGPLQIDELICFCCDLGIAPSISGLGVDPQYHADELL